MISQWVKDARTKAGKSQEALAHDVDVTKGNVSAWENERHQPNIGQVIDISLVTNYPVPVLVKEKLEAALEIAAGGGGNGFRIQLLANEASMGAGESLQAEDVLSGSLTLTTQFVMEHIHPTSPAALRFIHAYGDSMAPTLNSGDVLLVDTGIQEVKIDGIYVLRAHGRLFVKRVRQRMDGHYEISSDNPTHKTVDVLNGDHQVTVVGRVVWYWNGHKT